MWDFRRKGWTFRSGGDGADAPSGSGLFKSTDGGATWTRSRREEREGLPAKALGPHRGRGRAVASRTSSTPSSKRDRRRTALPLRRRRQDLAAARPQPDHGLAAVLLREPDRRSEGREQALQARRLDLIVSTDGGKSFSNVGGGAHGDFHDVWIDPTNTDHLIAGDDGGVWYSYDGGNKWWKADNLPISQFYHVSVDMDDAVPRLRRPAGQQLLGRRLARTPAASPTRAGRTCTAATASGCSPIRPTRRTSTPKRRAATIGRVNRKTHESRDIQPLPRLQAKASCASTGTRRFTCRPTQKGTIYIGAQFLFRSRDHGQTWERISPDLTTNDPEKQKQEESGGVTVDNSAAEMHTTIYAIGESPKDADLIWVGTDDGNLQVTRDGGKTWTNVVGNMPGLPEECVGLLGRGRPLRRRHRLRHVRPAHLRRHDAVRLPDDRLRQDLDGAVSPADGAMRGYAHVIKQDLVNPDLLFLGHRDSASGSRSTAASSGRSTRAAISRTSRCATWRSIRATRPGASPRTDAASGSSTTSRRCAR